MCYLVFFLMNHLSLSLSLFGCDYQQVESKFMKTFPLLTQPNYLQLWTNKIIKQKETKRRSERRKKAMQ